jgi:small-conductance mechanosensitive channel
MIDGISPLHLAATQLQHATAGGQITAALVALAFAALAARAFHGRKWGASSDLTLQGTRFATTGFWLTATVVLWLGEVLMRTRAHPPAEGMAIVDVVMAVTGGMATAAFSAYVVAGILPPGSTMRRLQRAGYALAGFIVTLWLVGVWPEMMEALERVRLTGKPNPLTLKTVLLGLISLAASLAIAHWLSRLLERRILAAQGFELSFRVVAVKFLRAVLLLVAVLIGLRLANVDLTLLSVFGGALGVGLGLGLQKIASNYVSGFIILLDRSIRIGDYVSVDKWSGVVQGIYARYTVLRTGDGTEAIIPNDTMISTVVSNFSFTDKRATGKVSITIALDSDVDMASQILVDAVRELPRVLTDPAPTVAIVRVYDLGIELELLFWINDPQSGTGSIRSQVFRAALADFRTHGIYLAR